MKEYKVLSFGGSVGDDVIAEKVNEQIPKGWKLNKWELGEGLAMVFLLEREGVAYVADTIEDMRGKPERLSPVADQTRRELLDSERQHE